jgi:hypothetical protein
MKTIKEAAKKYADLNYPKCEMHDDWDNDGFDEGYNTAANYKALDAFEAGARFAQRWISVYDELPEYAGYVLIKNEDSDVSTAFFGKVGGKMKFVIDFDGISSKNVIYWRHIELK